MVQSARGDGGARRAPGAAVALAELVELLSAPIDVSVVQQRVVDSLRAILGTRIAVLYGRNGSTTDLVALASSGEVETATLARLVFPAGTGAVGRAILDRRPVVSANVLTDPGITLTPGLRAALDQMAARTILAVPLIVEDEVLGALVTRDQREPTFEAEEVTLAEAFAAVAARAIRNARLHEEMARGRREAEVMAEVSRALNAVLELDAVLQLVTDRARELCQSDIASIALREGTGTMRARGRARDARGIRAGAGAGTPRGGEDRPRSRRGGPTGMRLLVADDDAMVRRLLERTLARWGYEVRAVADGTEAWQVLEAADRPEAAILDWMMPGLTGIDVCRRVRERSPEAGTYLILLTSKDRMEDAVEALEAGADDHIAKPFAPEELRARVRVGERIVALQQTLGQRVRALEDALQQVKRLQGLLPICAWCKKVRNDQNYWQGVDVYIAEHSDAQVTHGICPDCRAQLRQGAARLPAT